MKKRTAAKIATIALASVLAAGTAFGLAGCGGGSNSGKHKIALHGAGVGYRLDMHVQRTAGILTALIMEGDATYTASHIGGAVLTKETPGGLPAIHGQIVGDLMAGGEVKVEDFASDTIELVGYHALWDFGETAWQETLSNIVASEPEYVLCAGSGLDVYGASVEGTDIQIADVDSFTSRYGEAMEDGTVAYLAGKYSSSVGPIFAAVLNAVAGNPVRTAQNEALALGQGYWVATSYSDFTKFQQADTATAPIFNRALLDTVIGAEVTYDAFKAFVEADRTPGVYTPSGTQESTATYPTEKVKIGVLVADATGAEAQGFRNYYEQYLANKYNVEFVYSAELASAEAETQALEQFNTAGVNAVISLASADRPAQIEYCQNHQIYYAVATGTLTDEQYEAHKNKSYYVGAIGPSLDVEFQAGYDMGKWAVEQFKK